MLIAQISDPHIRENRAPIGPVDTALCLERAVDAINAFTPRIEVVLLSGDIGNDGTPGEYAIARSILDRLMMPLYVIPGNHDRRKPLAASFAGLSTMYADSPYLQYSADIGPIRLLALDTLVEGRSEGALCNDRLDWLALELAGAERPVMVMMHHPPIRCGIGQNACSPLSGDQRCSSGGCSQLTHHSACSSADQIGVSPRWLSASKASVTSVIAFSRPVPAPPACRYVPPRA